MSPSLNTDLTGTLAAIEQLRERKLLILAASSLDLDILPCLYEQLCAIGKVERLDVLLHSQCGDVNAARRVALLLRQFAGHLSVIVPFRCGASATVLALAADDIVAGDLAIFSPIAPQLAGGAGDQPGTLSCMDIKSFGAMSRDWFGVDAEQARGESLALMCNSIFPPTLTGFYRSTQEVQSVAEELLAFQLDQASADARRSVVEHLMYGYHSHNYAITREEMAALGLNVHRQPAVEALAWDVSTMLQSHVGRAARESAEAPWNDVLIATGMSLRVRRHRDDGLTPQWTRQDLAG